MTRKSTASSRGDLVARLASEVQRLEPSSKLDSERQLAERFAISRPVIREALRELQERGLVDIVNGRGAFVRQASTLDASRPVGALYRRSLSTPRHLVEARLMLERTAASMAAEHASTDDVAAIERAWEGFTNAPDLFSRAQADIAFHGLIVRAGHNPVIEIMYGSISGLVFELMLRSLSDPDIVAAGSPHHDTVLAAIREHDPESAEQAMDEHLTVAYQTYGADLDQPLDHLAQHRIDLAGGMSDSIENLVADAFAYYGDPDASKP